MMTIATSFVGVDISRDTLDIGVYPEGIYWRVANSPAGIAEALTRFKTYNIQAIAMEATGGWERSAASAFRGAGYVLHVLNPRRIVHFRKVAAQEAKTDRIDALLIAQFAATMPLQTPFVPEPHRIRLRDLAARREQLVRVAADAKKQIQQTHDSFIRDSITRQIAHCTTEITTVEQEMHRIIDSHETLKQHHKLIVSIPGIGNLSAMILLAELPEIGTLKPKKLAALIGVAPYPKQSGTQTKKAQIKGGRARIRSKCFILAHNAIRYNPWIAEYANHLKKRGKARRQIIIACINKLMHLIHAIIKRNSPWILSPLTSS